MPLIETLILYWIYSLLGSIWKDLILEVLD